MPLSQRWIAQGLQSWQVALHHLDRLAQPLHHLKVQSQASVETRQLLQNKVSSADCLHFLPPAVFRLICSGVHVSQMELKGNTKCIMDEENTNHVMQQQLASSLTLCAAAVQVTAFP